jgi:hypothetical protein
MVIRAVAAAGTVVVPEQPALIKTVTAAALVAWRQMELLAAQADRMAFLRLRAVMDQVAAAVAVIVLRRAAHLLGRQAASASNGIQRMDQVAAAVAVVRTVHLWG